MGHVLIVEDEELLAKALLFKLKHEGLEADHVFDGEQAVRAINERSYDLVLLDLVMPKLDGFGVLKAMKEGACKSVPTIVLSNLSQADDERKVLELGARAFFIKSNTEISFIVEKAKEMLSA